MSGLPLTYALFNVGSISGDSRSIAVLDPLIRATISNVHLQIGEALASARDIDMLSIDGFKDSHGSGGNKSPL
jgi:hypothetical protein